jgi:hypothetical protein
MPSVGAAAVKAGFDPHGGVRFTLEGRVLTAKIVRHRADEHLSAGALTPCAHPIAPVRAQRQVVPARASRQ